MRAATQTTNRFPLSELKSSQVENGSEHGSESSMENDEKHSSTDSNLVVERTTGIVAYKRDGRLHREDGPALSVQAPDGSYTFYWYRDGVKSRHNGLPCTVGRKLEWRVGGEAYRRGDQPHNVSLAPDQATIDAAFNFSFAEHDWVEATWVDPKDETLVLRRLTHDSLSVYLRSDRNETLPDLLLELPWTLPDGVEDDLPIHVYLDHKLRLIDTAESRRCYDDEGRLHGQPAVSRRTPHGWFGLSWRRHGVPYRETPLNPECYHQVNKSPLVWRNHYLYKNRMPDTVDLDGRMEWHEGEACRRSISSSISREWWLAYIYPVCKLGNGEVNLQLTDHFMRVAFDKTLILENFDSEGRRHDDHQGFPAVRGAGITERWLHGKRSGYVKVEDPVFTIRDLSPEDQETAKNAGLSENDWFAIPLGGCLTQDWKDGVYQGGSPTTKKMRECIQIHSGRSLLNSEDPSFRLHDSESISYEYVSSYILSRNRWSCVIS